MPDEARTVGDRVVVFPGESLPVHVRGGGMSMDDTEALILQLQAGLRELGVHFNPETRQRSTLFEADRVTLHRADVGSRHGIGRHRAGLGAQVMSAATVRDEKAMFEAPADGMFQVAAWDGDRLVYVFPPGDYRKGTRAVVGPFPLRFSVARG